MSQSLLEISTNSFVMITVLIVQKVSENNHVIASGSIFEVPLKLGVFLIILSFK